MYNPYQQQGMGYPQQQPQQTGYGFNNFQQPGQQQQQQQQQFQQPMYTQATGFTQQPNLYGNFQNNNQPFGQQPSLQPQQTGFTQQSGFMQPQQTGYIQTQPTGFGASTTVIENSELKIPSIRLSFITVEDQKKFEHLFRSAVPKGEQSITGESASNILLRSGLSPITLAEIWSLSDIDKTGSLLFPEFALSLHLCSMAKRNEPLPGVLPEKWLNEVKSFMDAINFSIPDDPSKVLANTPFASFAPKKNDGNEWLQPQSTGFGSNNLFQPQQTGYGAPPSTSFGALSAQRTGGGTLIPLQPQQTAGLIPAQKTGPLQQQSTGFQPMQQQRTGGALPQQNTGYPQQSGLPQQTTGFLNQQSTGFLNQQRTGGYTPSFQQQQTGGFMPQTSFQQQLSAQRTGPLQSQPTGPLQAQPTGRPGEWGFVSMPTGGIPGLNAMQQHFLPNTQLPSSNLQNAMDNTLKANVTWAITKQEKQIYDGLFQAWDPERKGYVDSSVALGVFTKSGLSRPDLESIWTLVDTDDTGKLNKNQFAVAMHLIYRRLNGYDIPIRLPPELIPPADKTLKDTMDNLKNSLKNGGTKPNKPQKPQTKPDGSRFKNDDNNFGYVSSSRHRSKSSSKPRGSLKSSSDADLSVDDMKKLIREKKILLDALDVEDQDSGYANSGVNHSVVDSLKDKIKDVQSKINQSGMGLGSNDEKKQLLSTLDHLTRDKVPKLISDIHQVNSEIARRKVELLKLQIKKEHPDWNPEDDESQIEGTGPNGEVTELDRKKFQQRQKLKQRMAALTGKSSSGSNGANSDLDLKLKQASDDAQREAKNQSEMISDIESGIKAMEDECASKLQISTKDDSGYEKWEKGVGISHEVAKFVKDLEAFSNSQRKNIEQSRKQEPPKQTQQQPLSKQTTGASVTYESYKTPEERAAYIKAQAEKRMNERLAKLGISRRGKTSEIHEESSSKPAEPAPAKFVKAEPFKAEPFKAEPAKAESIEPTQTKPVESAQQPKEKPSADEQISSDEDDDAEYQELLKEKQRIEKQRKLEKAERKRKKEERLAQLKRDMEAMKNSKDDSEDEEEPVTQVHVYSAKKDEPTKEIPTQKPASSDIGSASVLKSEIIENSKEETPQRHENNPFAKMKNNEQQQQPNGETGSNLFFKPKQQEVPADPKKAAAQRQSQRGISSTSGWSDSEEDESEDDQPNRAGAAKLASLLFGGMPQAPRTDSENSKTKPEEKIATHPQQSKDEEPIPTEPSGLHPLENQHPPASTYPESDSSDEFDFETPDPQPHDIPPPVPSEAPPLPTSDIPPIPANSYEQNEVLSGPPPPAPPLPPPQAPPVPSSIPPPPSFEQFGGSNGAPLAPPPPPPPPAASIPSQPTGGAPNIGALLGQITGGKSLKKVETKESSGATVGRVL